MTKRSLRLVLSLLIALQAISRVSCLEVIFDRNFQKKVDCLYGIESQVTNILGTPYTDKCLKACQMDEFNNDSTVTVLQIISTIGAVFTFPMATYTEPYSYIQLDITYIMRKNNLEFEIDINGLATDTIGPSSTQSTLEDAPNIVCYRNQVSQISTYSLTLKQQLPAGTDLKISFNDNVQYGLVFLRSIRVSKNCTPNCSKCQNGNSCSVCMDGFSLYTFSSGPSVCEQIGVCSSSNCFSCALYNSQEKCLKCDTGYTLSSTSGCVANSPSPSAPCASNEYNNNGTCAKYSSIGYFQNRQTGSMTLITNQLDVQTEFKCPANTLALVYSQGNYSIYQCRCMFEDCVGCTSIDTCDLCVSGMKFDLKQKKCVTSTIKQNNFKIVSKTTNTGYELQLVFDNDLESSQLDSSQLKLDITNFTDFTYTFEGFSDAKTLTFKIVCNSSVKNVSATVTINDLTFLQNNNLSQASQSQILPSFSLIPISDQEAAQNFEDIGGSFTKVFVIVLIIIAFFGRFQVFVNFIDIIGILYYLLFIDVVYPTNIVKLSVVLKNFQMGFFPNFFSGIVSSNYAQYAPPLLANSLFDSYFLTSSGRIISFFIFVLGIYLVVKIFSGIQLEHIQQYCKRACHQTWEFSGFLNAIWAIHIYAFVGVLLQFYDFDCGDSSCVFNYFWFGLWTLICISVPLWVTHLLYSNPNIKDDKSLMLKYSTLVDGLKLFSAKDPLIPRDSDLSTPPPNNHLFFPTLPQTESQIPSQSQQNLSFREKLILKFSKYNIAILYLRKLLFCLIIAYLHKSSYAQLILISLMNGLIVFYYFFIQPFQSSYENIKNAVSELILIIIQVLIITLVKGDNQTEGDRIKIGWVIISIVSALILWHFLGIIFDFFQVIFEYLKSQKARRNRQKVANFDSKEEGMNEQYSPTSPAKKRMSNQQKLGTLVFQNVEEEQPGEDEEDENNLQSQRLKRNKVSSITQIRREGSINNMETFVDNTNASPEISPNRRATSRLSVTHFNTQTPQNQGSTQQLQQNDNGQDSVFDIPFSNNQMIKQEEKKTGFKRFTKIRSILEN